MKRGVLVISSFILILLMLVTFVSAFTDLTVDIKKNGNLADTRVCVKNVGDTNVGQTSTIFNFSKSQSTKFEEYPGIIEPLKSGEEHCYSALYNSDTAKNLFDSEEDLINFQVIVDSANEIEEENEANNIASVSYTFEEVHAQSIATFKQVSDEEAKKIFITEEIAGLTLHGPQVAGLVNYNNIDCGVLSQEGNLNYIGFYSNDNQETIAMISIIEVPEELENRAVLEDSIKCYFKYGQQQNINFNLKNFEGNEYLYAEVPEYSSSRGEYKSDYHLWYNGNKIIMLSYEKAYSNQGDELLKAYFDKYPSELSAPMGLIQAIIEWFRKLFGIQ